MKRSWIYRCVAVSIMASSVVLGGKPVAEVAVQPATGVAPEFAGDIENFGSLLRSALSAGGVLDVVDRTEFGDLVKAREFSMASSAEPLQSGVDAASNFRIATKVAAFALTGVTQGVLRAEFRGLAVARVVDVEKGISIVDARSDIKGFYASATEAASALALDLANKINETIGPKLSSAGGAIVPAGSAADGEGSPGEMTIVRVKENGEILVSDDQKVLAIGDELTVFQKEEFPDPRNPGKMLVDETVVGKIKVDRISSIGAYASAVTPDATFAALMIARKTGGAPPAGVTRATMASASVPGKKAIPVTGEKPTLAIGKFKYSNEFDLSQTADRSGKPIGSAGAGQGIGAVGGAIAGGLVGAAVGGTKEVLAGIGVGALGGQAVDAGIRGQGDGPKEAKIPNDTNATAIGKESQVLREMVVTKAQKSGKFTVIEQTRMDEIKGQMDNEMDGDYDQGALVQRGKMQSAKYSAFGTITRYETYRKQTGYSIAGGNETLTMKVTLDMRLVDNELGTVVGSDQVTGQIDTTSSQVGILGLGRASESQGEIGRLLDNLAQNVVAKIVTTLYPIHIIAVNSDEKVVMINAGETVVSVGERLIVYARGNEVVDPYTGEVLGSEEMTVGEVEVYETRVKFANCRIIKPIQRPGDLKVGQICRPLETADVGGRPAQVPESKPKFTF